MDFENWRRWDWGLRDVRLQEIVLPSAAGHRGSLMEADSHAHPSGPQLSVLRALTLACTHLFPLTDLIYLSLLFISFLSWVSEQTVNSLRAETVPSE